MHSAGLRLCKLSSSIWHVPNKHLFHSVFQALFITFKEYVNDPAFQLVVLNLFLLLEDQMKCHNILRPCFSDWKMYRPQQCI